MRQDGTKVLAYNRDGQETIGVAVDANEIYFRTDMDKDQAKVSYGFDGKTWTPFGEQTFRMRFGRWRGDRLGFYCWNDLRDEGHVDIDWFRYDYNGPKGSGHKAP
jgi:hypothetical protein